MGKLNLTASALIEDYQRILSVKAVAGLHGVSHSAVWKRIGPVLPIKREMRWRLAEKPEGLSASEWAEMNGVSVSTYYYWRRQYENQRAAQREIKDTDDG